MNCTKIPLTEKAANKAAAEVEALKGVPIHVYPCSEGHSKGVFHYGPKRRKGRKRSQRRGSRGNKTRASWKNRSKRTRVNRQRRFEDEISRWFSEGGPVFYREME